MVILEQGGLDALVEAKSVAGPVWRLVCRLAALLCVPLAAWAAYDSAIAFWATQPADTVPLVLRANPQLRWTRVEARTIDPRWLAANAAEVKASALAQLRVSAGNASAVRGLGQVASLHAPDDGLLQFRQVERLTRRDAFNELQLIGAASRSGDIADGLRHYDRIMLAAPTAQEKLFPTLARAIAYANVREPLAAFAARAWFSQFLSVAIDQGADPAAAADLYAKSAHAIAQSDKQTVGMRLITQLVGRARLAEARGIASTIPGLDSALLGDFGLNAATTNPSLAPLTWKLANDEAVESAFTPPGRLVIRIASGRTLAVADRLVLAEPGRFVLSHEVQYESGEAAAGLTWTVTCADGTRLAPLRVPVAPGRHRFSARIDVPPGCGAQSWQLTATPEETQSTSSVTIAGLSLVPQ